MFAEPRLFQSEADLTAMMDLVAHGRKADNGTYYVHPGDLAWWYAYFLAERDLRQHTFLWEGPHGRLDGWALIPPAAGTLDVFVRPELRGQGQAEAMLDWAVDWASRTSPASDRPLHSLWVSELDGWLGGRLAAHGFRPSGDFMFKMVRSLDEPVDAPRLPVGFCVRLVAGEHEAPLRAAVQASAFDSTLPFDRYLDRYVRFMKSAFYPVGLDLMLTAPDGRAGAFCICWTDSLNRVGLFEPVGVHPDFQRMGLGKAVMQAGLSELLARGMEAAQVCVGAENQAARRLYEAAGFCSQERLVTWVKPRSG